MCENMMLSTTKRFTMADTNSDKKMGYWSPLIFFSAARTRDRPSRHRVTVDQDGTTANDVVTKSGYGAKDYANGDLYSGEWKSNKQHGFGVYTWAIGDVYVGGWENDKRHGVGTYTYKNPKGDEYSGQWYEDSKHGVGTYKWANGDEYTGEWRDGKRNGQGVLTHNSTNHPGQWSGQWKDDRMHGLGTYRYNNTGDEYSGEWRENKRVGSFLSLPSKIVESESSLQQSKDKDKRPCCICQEEFCQGEKRTMLPCNHGFHTNCVNQWLSSNSCCPICRLRLGLSR